MIETTITELQAVRAQISAKRAEIHELVSAPLRIADIERRVDAWIAKAAGQVNQRSLLAQLQAPDAENSLGLMLDRVLARSPGAGVASLLCWLQPDDVKARLMAAVKHRQDGGGAPLRERPAEQRRLESELYALETQEERLVTGLELAGVEVYRRPDVDPLIVLGVERLAAVGVVIR